MNIIIKGWDLGTIFFQNIRSVSTAEVLPVKIEFGEKTLSSLYKLVDKVIVTISSDTLVTISQVVGIVSQFFPVGTGIDNQGENAGRINSCSTAVYHQLSYGNIHTIGAPVPYSENSFRIGYHNETDFPVSCGVFQGLFNIFRMVNVQISRILRIHKKITIALNG